MDATYHAARGLEDVGLQNDPHTCMIAFLSYLLAQLLQFRLCTFLTLQ